MPKNATSSVRESRRHNPLHEELLADPTLRKVARAKRRDRIERNDDGYYEISARHKRMATEQQDEVDAELAAAGGGGGAARGGAGFAMMRFAAEDDEEDDDDEEYAEWQDEGEGEIEEVDEVEVDAEDAAVFEKFLPNAGEERISLADKILEKIAEYEAWEAGVAAPGRGAGGQEGEVVSALPPKVVEVYSQIGLLLSRYKSGKLPKAFKIIPSLKNWEEIVFITRPDNWTPHAMYEATRLFAAQKSSQMQRFVNIILLERVRDEIQEHKKLNVHLYNAIKKSLYKPAAFFKGFLFPLVSSGCTLKEAQIIASVLTRISIPVLHSAAALLRLCEMPYTPATAEFIRILIDKKYALPYKVVDALVFYWMRFRAEPDAMPLLWHKGFLAFAQRYKNDITEDQRDVLLDVLLVKGHEKIAPEIRRELVEGRARGVELEMKGAGLGAGLGDDDVVMD